jgi:uncharacterized membrane protein
MALTLLTGLPVILICLILEAVFIAWCIRYYGRFVHLRESSAKLMRVDILLLSIVMLLTLVGNCVQMMIWAALFMTLGEFDSYALALYHSAVNFTTLGYGDVVMSERWRLLGPIEAANGILMFGVSTALMTAAVTDILKFHFGRRGAGPKVGIAEKTGK